MNDDIYYKIFSKKYKKRIIKKSINLTGSDITNMLGRDAVDAYNSSKAEERELEETIEIQKKNVMEMFKRTVLIL